VPADASQWQLSGCAKEIPQALVGVCVPRKVSLCSQISSSFDAEVGDTMRAVTFKQNPPERKSLLRELRNGRPNDVQDMVH
jgi:hypothetical protein